MDSPKTRGDIVSASARSERIETVQRVVKSLAKSMRRELKKKAPTAPDLWLVDRQRRHRFVEVKLPGDSVASHQIAGMAAIACVLGRYHSVSVEVLHLDDDLRLFKEFCRAAKLANKPVQPTQRRGKE